MSTLDTSCQTTFIFALKFNIFVGALTAAWMLSNVTFKIILLDEASIKKD